MRYSNLLRSDLNLLVSFQVLMEERNVTAAANRMFLSQPAMSRVLERLRQLFKDPLLIRTRRGYEVTRRAVNIFHELESLLPKIETILTESQFDAAGSADHFRVAMTDNAALSLLPKAVSQVSASSKRITLEVVSWKEDSFNRLIANALDLVIWIDEAPSPLKSEALFDDEFVCLVRKGHPIGQSAMTVERYLSMGHLVVSLAGARQGRLDAALTKLGYDRAASVSVPFFGCVAPLVERTDLIATIPRRLAKVAVKRSDTTILKLPIELPPIEYIQVWHPRNDLDAAHQWLRRVFRQAATSG